jgi:hypothetical protein
MYFLKNNFFRRPETKQIISNTSSKIDDFTLSNEKEIDNHLK